MAIPIALVPGRERELVFYRTDDRTAPNLVVVPTGTYIVDIYRFSDDCRREKISSGHVVSTMEEMEEAVRYAYRVVVRGHNKVCKAVEACAEEGDG